MKGAPVKTLRSTVSAFLDKVSSLLQSEPARLIGYGAAVVIYLAARILADKGILDVQLTFDQSITAAVAAIAVLVGIVESIRRFVYSPLTYIEDLADEYASGHEQAHFEEEMKRAFAEAVENVKTRKRTVAVGTAKAAGAKDSAN